MNQGLRFERSIRFVILRLALPLVAVLTSVGVDGRAGGRELEGQVAAKSARGAPLAESGGKGFEAQAGRMAPTLLFPQLVSGGGTVSQIILTNPSTNQDRGTLFFFGDGGEPLEVRVGGKSAASVGYVVPPGGAFNLLTDEAGTLSTGYAMAVSEDPESRLSGTIVYRIQGFEVSVPASPVGTRFRSFVEEDVGIGSGLAFVNVSGQAAELSLTLRDRNGTARAETELDLAAGAHLARFAGQLFPGLEPGFLGTVEVDSSTSFSLVGLRQKASGSLAVLSVATPELGRARLGFPQIADGGGIRSEVLLMNLGDQGVEGTVEFFDPQGGPLQLSIGGAVGNSVPFSLPAGGAAKLETDGVGAARSGYSRIVATDPGAELLANVVYSLGNFEVSVAPSESGLSHHVSFERSSDFDTGVALVNPNEDAIQVSAFLVDHEGARVGQQAITLAAHSQQARFVSQIFPQVPSPLRGTIQLRGGGPFSAMGLRQRVDGSLASLSGSPTSLNSFGAAVAPASDPELTFVAVFDDGEKLFGLKHGSNGETNGIVWLGPNGKNLVVTAVSGVLSRAVFGQDIYLFSPSPSRPGRVDIAVVSPATPVRIEREVDLGGAFGANSGEGLATGLAADLRQGRRLFTGFACAASRVAPLLGLENPASEGLGCPTGLEVGLETLTLARPSLDDAAVGFNFIGCGSATAGGGCPGSLIAQARLANTEAANRVSNAGAALADASARLQCADLGGSWDGREKGDLRCTFSVGNQSESFDETIAGATTVSITQNACSFTYDPGGEVGGRRTGRITGSRVTVEGKAAIPGEGVQSVTSNSFQGSGELVDGALHLAGNGSFIGTVQGEGGVTVAFNCSTQTEADLTRQCAFPVDAVRTRAFASPGGFLVMSYGFSSSGTLDQLSQCRIFEMVEYPKQHCTYSDGTPCYNWQRPPWDQSTNNPEIIYIEKRASELCKNPPANGPPCSFQDTHETGVFSAYPREASFVAVQRYYYECACDNWQPHFLYGPAQIRRSVVRTPMGDYLYRIVKTEPDGARFESSTEVN